MSEHRASIEWQGSGEFRYVDHAVGVLDKTWMSRVTLRPRVTFSGPAPDAAALQALHHRAHEKCFIANSVKSEVVVEPC